MSGGVDSSVSAALLKKDGYSVIGVFIKVWHPDFLPCDWEKERLDAMRVCVRLDIPFLTLDLEKEYKRFVVDYMIEEYQKGRTPNPDVMCNKHVKFDAFLSFARTRGADYIATGHYAQIGVSVQGSGFSRNNNKLNAKRYTLYAGRDSDKDQSYFLWTLPQETLRFILFPVGAYKKSDVRALAKEFGLPTAEKKDSQGICFLGKVDMGTFLTHYIPVHEGVVVTKEGAIVGTHKGAQLYTIGERHGIVSVEKSTTRAPYYVMEKDIEKNILVVSHTPHDPVFSKKKVVLESAHWISDIPETGKTYRARFRHLGALSSCTVEKDTVAFVKPQHGLARGQSLVIYDGDMCVGGGIIS